MFDEPKNWLVFGFSIPIFALKFLPYVPGEGCAEVWLDLAVTEWLLHEGVFSIVNTNLGR